MADDLKRTPLHEHHRGNGARFVPFEGWEMPVQFRGIKEEHRLVREKAGLFDVSHMGEFRVRGSDAVDFLNLLVTNDVGRLKDGRGVYSPMCDERGGVVDDLILYRLQEEEFVLVVNAANREKDFTWISEAASDSTCTVVDETESWALLALQGPLAEAILTRAAGAEVAKLGRFHIATFSIAGVSCMIARTGYTGEDGFEVFCESVSAGSVAMALEEAGGEAGLGWAGLGSRDSLRLEAGFPLYGHEISKDIDPISGGIGWTVKEKKAASFHGKLALETIRKDGPRQKIAHFVVDDRRMARTGMEVFHEGTPRGTVVSSAYSPILEAPMGAALIQSSFLNADSLYVESRGHRMPLLLKKPPLHH